MILAALVRGYKCYDRSYFLPITKTPYFPYSAFVGQNGVGKSAVLESIDVFFEQRDWNINKKTKKDEVYVAPLFLMSKERVKANAKQKELLDELTKYFLTATSAINPQLKGEAFQKLFQFRDEIIREVDMSKYYLFVFGVSFLQRGCPYFSIFDNDLKNNYLAGKGFGEDDLKGIMKLIFEHYSYIYIPVEGYVEDVLALETYEMKELMSRDVLNEIDSVLTKKLDIEGKKVSLITWLNDSLDEFMDEVNEAIIDVDDSYTFKVGGHKRNVTAKDVREQIIDAYFSIRTLKKNKKDISELSSGEQRQALIDIAYAFLSQRKESSKSIILAVDEPEVSLNVSRCLPQFERLYNLVDDASCQIIFTTHWYGFLPAIQNGTVAHVCVNDDGVNFETFEMPSLYDQRRRFPNDVELKSVFDFISSIVSLIRHKKVNVMIVEGIEDYWYIKSHMRRDDVRIIPVGGAGNVIKIFNHLRPAFDDDKSVGRVKGRIVCLIDTDDDLIPFNGPAQDKNRRVYLKRLQAINQQIELVAPDAGGRHKKTEIEDAVDAHAYVAAAYEALRKYGDKDENRLIALYDARVEPGYSLLNYENSALRPKDVIGYRSAAALLECLEKYKKEIAREYYELAKLIGAGELEWLSKIEGDHFVS